ncbi:MAG: hypothetical protein P4L72_15750 [Parvibaculum sp.]|uniref:hypothetical protein n=1 Tax=Parvibaculum sp. TaxID=2024848 RepID=UPI00284246CB|nr:hypothetical protein [Parvibaculum sp.]MDR3500669.1 hypothetical protein [Parvibaculum sp.]
MPTIEVDLRTKVLPQTTNVYVGRPGKEYRLYHQFTEGHVIGPELPGLDLQPGVPLAQQTLMDNRIRRSVRLRNWHGRGRPEDDVPPTALEAYNGHLAANALGQYRSVVTGYFERVNAGDLVIIPPQSFSQDAVVGEFIGGPTDFESFNIPRYVGHPLLVRRFRTVGRIPKPKLNARILDLITKPNMLVLLERQLRSEIYSAVYGNYTTADSFNTRLEVAAREFTTDDDFNIKLFIKFVTQNTIKTSINGEDEVFGIKVTAFEDAGDLAPDLQMNINSPGFIGISSKFLIPSVISVLFALAVLHGADVVHAAEAGKILIGNSSAPAGDACTAEIAEVALKQIKLLGLDKWPEACEYARKVAEHAQMTTSTRVVQKP